MGRFDREWHYEHASFHRESLTSETVVEEPDKPFPPEDRSQNS